MATIKITKRIRYIQLVTSKVYRKPSFVLFIIRFNFRYNINRLWFPQLSTIVEHYKVDDNQDLCAMLDTYTEDLRTKDRNYNASDVCIAVSSVTHIPLP